jgi:TonB-linked SusC/RagA family outer membrane protein
MTHLMTFSRAPHSFLPRRTSGPVRVAALKALFLCLILAATTTPADAQHRVRGTVTAADDGLPLAGVNVFVVGTTAGAATAANGQYEVVVPSETVTLRFSFIGYETQHIPVDGREVIDVVMQVDPILGDEVVVVGYGVQRRRDVTGAISRVEGEDVARVPVMNVEQALQGRVAGVQVVPASGEPGAGAVVRIRGVGTLNNASPLYVVDGMLLDDIGFLNPSDIESIDVLKDASATAIYGSRGANGVIIVTTRRAAMDRPFINLGTYFGFEQIGNRIDVVNAQQYATLANELAANEGLAPFFEDPAAFGEGTDWQNEIFQAAPMQNYHFSASGATERVSYFISGNYTHQDGILPRSEFGRASLRINNEYRVSELMTVGHNLSFTHTDSRAAPPVATTAYLSDPTIAPLNEEGYFSDLSVRGMGNPLATIEYTRNVQGGNRLVGNMFADFDFLRHFNFRSSFGVDLARNEGRTFVPEFFVSPIQQSPQRAIHVSNSFANTWLWENTVTYRQLLEDHSITVLGGVTAQEFAFENLGGSRVNVIGESPHLWYLNAGDTEGQTNFNVASSWGMLSYLGRTNYSYLDRYLVTASVRVDGSSRFGPDNRYGVFPSFALGWMLSEEPFLRDVELISSLKLRGSYGVIGNDKIGPYPGRPVVTGNLNAPFGIDPSLHFGASLIELANPDVAWESTSQFNLGVEFSTLQHRLSADIDYYNRVTNDILVQVPIPGYVGVNVEPFVNAAQVRNSGFDLTLRYGDQLGDFSYRVSAVGSTVNNTVLSLGQGREEIFGGPVGEGGKLATRTVVGQPIGSFFGYRVVGVFQNEEELQQYARRGPERPGDLRFEDITGDGVITTDDRTFLGSPYPDYIFGFSFGAGWRGLDLDIDFNGQYGNLIYNAKRAARFGIYNFETTFLDRWHGEGTSDLEPRITNAGHNYEVSDRFLEDGSFLKVRNVRLTYTLPTRMTSVLAFANARVYVNGANLHTFTRYTGYTPEIMGASVLDAGVDRGFYPPSRTFTVGLDLTF